MKLYFERFDGQAVTCDDFVQCMADANPSSPLAQHLEAFKRWYSQAGTPVVHASGAFDADTQTYRLTLRQSCPATPGQSAKAPFVIPVTLGLLDASGQQLPLHIDGQDCGLEHTLVLTEAEQTWEFTNLGHLTSAPVPSLLRDFSSPVQLDYAFTEHELLTQLAHDANAFNRWEAGQRLLLQAALKGIADSADEQSTSGTKHLETGLLQALRALLLEEGLDPAFKELALTLPSESYIAEQLPEVDPQRIHTVREAMRLELALALQADWQATYSAHADTGAYQPDAASSGRRALANLALAMLCLAAQATGDSVWPGKAYQRFKTAGNLTDRVGALNALLHSHSPLAQPALERFYALAKDEPLVLDKWFALQAARPDQGGSVLPQVQQLLKHPNFVLKNPNRARSLVFTYCSANPGAFHRTDGGGYQFWAEHVLALDAINPQVAARLARGLDRWKKLAQPYQDAAKAALQQVATHGSLSNDVREIISHALA